MIASISGQADDGVKVGLAHYEAGVPLICLETALPAKFEATIQEALGRPPERPLGYKNIEALPQRCEAMEVSVGLVKHRSKTTVRSRKAPFICRPADA